MHWMDGGIQPERPEELQPNEIFGDGGNGTLFTGTKGKMMCDTYGLNPRLLPLSKNENLKVAQKYIRVKDGAEGHYRQWVEAAIAGYGKKELKSAMEMLSKTSHYLFDMLENLLVWARASRGKMDINKENIPLFTIVKANVELLINNAILKRLSIKNNTNKNLLN